MGFLSVVFHRLGCGVTYLAVLIAERTRLADHLLVGLEQAYIDRAVAGLGGDITRNGEGDAEARDVLALFGSFPVLFQRRNADACGVKLGSNGHLLRQRCTFSFRWEFSAWILEFSARVRSASARA